MGHVAWVLIVLSATYGLKLSTVAGQYILIVVSASLVGCVLGLVLLFWRDRRWSGSVLEQSALPRRRLSALVACGIAMQCGLVGYATQVRGALIGQPYLTLFKTPEGLSLNGPATGG